MDGCTPRQQETPSYQWTERVDLQPFQAAIGQMLEDPDFSWGEICRRLGWVVEKPDTSRLKRTLGLQDTGYGAFNKTVQYETAVKLCEALGLDPVDVGL